MSVDLRPINFDSARKDTLRIGFDFSKPLKSKRPSQSVMDQIRAQFRGGGERAGPQGAPTPPPATGSAAPPSGAAPPEGAPPPPAGPPPESGASAGGGDRGGGRGFGGGRGGRGGGGGGFFGGGSRGRLQFSLTDTITFVDKVTIAPGIPGLDYLHGDAAGSAGGTPRHQVQAQAGWSNNGLGARLGANWRSGTRVDTLTGDNLHFSPLATFDLRLFANPGDIPELALKHPWLRGTQVRLEATNLFDSKPKVHDALGSVPFNYQPDLLDPLGRTIMISFRKLFSPPPSFFRQQREREQQQQAQPPSRLRRRRPEIPHFEKLCLSADNDAGSARPGHAKPAWRRRRPPRRGGRGVRSRAPAVRVQAGRGADDRADAGVRALDRRDHRRRLQGNVFVRGPRRGIRSRSGPSSPPAFAALICPKAGSSTRR